MPFKKNLNAQLRNSAVILLVLATSGHVVDRTPDYYVGYNKAEITDENLSPPKCLIFMTAPGAAERPTVV